MSEIAFLYYYCLNKIVIIIIWHGNNLPKSIYCSTVLILQILQFKWISLCKKSSNRSHQKYAKIFPV